MSNRTNPQILTSIQAARGFAAIAVVLCHAGTILNSSQYLNYTPMHGIFYVGHAGVDFFFVLSGFVIASAHAGDLGHPEILTKYFWKRFVRIYPIYWASFSILLGLAALGFLPDINLAFDKANIKHLIFCTLLAPEHQSPVLGVSWTLGHEILFYAFFALLIAKRKLGLTVLTAWFSASFIGALFSHVDLLPFEPKSLITGWFFSTYHLQFALGMIAKELVFRDRVTFPRLIAIVGVVGIVLTAALENRGLIMALGQVDRLLFGLSSASVICGLATAERKGLICAWSSLNFLGAASYAIYLIHVPVMQAYAHLINTNHAVGWAVMLEMTSVGVTAGIVLHLTIERPILALRNLPLNFNSPGNSKQN